MNNKSFCRWIYGLLGALLAAGAFAQAPLERDPARLKWFADAKLGIFIHWGIYSLGDTSESWAFFQKKISHKDYMAQAGKFTAARYDPAAWVSLIKASGAKYAVITAKHHDGVALWDTRYNKRSIPRATPAGRDVLSPFVAELRRAGLKVGLYYSLIDWSDDNYPGFVEGAARYRLEDDPARWQRFLAFCHGQIAELLRLVGPDLFWFDGGWEHSAEEWQAEKIRHTILAANPATLINGRLPGCGDYETPEQNFPVTRPSAAPWELCMTTNDSWGYYKEDTHYKTPAEIIYILADCASMGGNLLLDIGPKADGTIPEEQVRILRELGTWTGKHGEAIFGTVAGLPAGHFYGPSTLAPDSRTLYLFLGGHPSGNVVLKGLNTTIREITVLGNGCKLEPKIVGKIGGSEVPGLVFIDVPAGVADPKMTVLKVALSEPLRLYRGHGGL